MFGHMDTPNFEFAILGMTGSSMPLGSVVNAEQIKSILPTKQNQVIPRHDRKSSEPLARCFPCMFCTKFEVAGMQQRTGEK
jgi:hypothetical protein